MFYRPTDFSLLKRFWKFLTFKHGCNFLSEYTIQSNFSSPCIIYRTPYKSIVFHLSNILNTKHLMSEKFSIIGSRKMPMKEGEVSAPGNSLISIGKQLAKLFQLTAKTGANYEVVGAFNLHLLEFTFIYQFYSRKTILVESIFWNPVGLFAFMSFHNHFKLILILCVT